jgi:hypothetical protein
VIRDGATDPSTDYQISELDHAAHMRSVLSADRHLIVGTDPRRVELFRIDEDPLETTNVASSAPADVAALQLVLDAYDRSHVRQPAERAQAPDQKEVERLRALGYVP